MQKSISEEGLDTRIGTWGRNCKKDVQNNYVHLL